MRTAQYTEHRLEVMQLACESQLSRHQLADLDVEILLHETGTYLAATLIAHLVGRKARGEVIRYPATWWDAFKARWFRGWLLRRFPVRWCTITPELTELFPDIKPVRGHRSFVIAELTTGFGGAGVP